MARKVTVEVVCDICQDLDDIQVEGTELPPIAVGTAKPRVMAVCKEHREGVESFLDMLKRLGVFPESLDQAVGKVPLIAGAQSGEEEFCPVPDCRRHTKPLKNRSTLQAHMRATHGMTLVEYSEQQDSGESAQPPLPIERDYSEFKCTLPDMENPKRKCGWVPPQSTSRPEQSRSMHRFRVHGIKKGDDE